MKIGLIGIGNMNGAILDGLLKESKYEIYITNRSTEKLVKYPANAIIKNIEELIEKVDVIILGYKPQGYIEFLEQYANKIGDKLFVSIAAGMRSTILDKYIKNYVITMPNAPVLINKGTIAIVDSKFNDIIQEIFDPLGKSFIIQEWEMDDFIAIAGSLPAYIYYLIDCISKSQSSIEQQLASKIITSAIEGSALMANNFDDMEELVDKVCSKNGTTIEAINTFKKHDLEAIVCEAITKCSNRSNEIAEEINSTI